MIQICLGCGHTLDQNKFCYAYSFCTYLCWSDYQKKLNNDTKCFQCGISQSKSFEKWNKPLIKGKDKTLCMICKAANDMDIAISNFAIAKGIDIPL